MKAVLPNLLPFLVTLWVRTVRVRVEGAPLREPVIYAFWHRHILAAVAGLRTGSHVALVSRSRDGRSLQNVLRRLGYGIVEGSSSTRGWEGWLGLRGHLQNGKSVLITPDGPKGPAGVLKEGVLLLAANTGKKIIPVTVSYSRAIRLRSWDSAIIPWPFSTCTVRLHPPATDAGQLTQRLHAS